MFDETWMIGEVVLLAVFEDKDAIFGEQFVLEDQVWDCRQVWQSVGWVGKDEVELLLARLYEAEHIAFDECTTVIIEFLQTLTNEVGMVAIQFDAYHRLCSTRQQLERYATRSGKEVESLAAIEVNISIHHVEDVLLGKVRCRTRLERTRHIEVPSLVFSCNYSHNL